MRRSCIPFTEPNSYASIHCSNSTALPHLTLRCSLCRRNHECRRRILPRLDVALRVPPPLPQVFVRGGLLLVVADSPQRALMLYCKHPNSSSLHPCPYCNLIQTGTDGGDLGDADYNTTNSKRTIGQIMRARRELRGIASTPSAQTTRSMHLGVVAPDPNQTVWPLHDLIRSDALKACPVESLHADALVSYSLEVEIPMYLKCGDGRDFCFVHSPARDDEINIEI